MKIVLVRAINAPSTRMSVKSAALDIFVTLLKSVSIVTLLIVMSVPEKKCVRNAFLGTDWSILRIAKAAPLTAISVTNHQKNAKFAAKVTS